MLSSISTEQSSRSSRRLMFTELTPVQFGNIWPTTLVWFPSGISTNTSWIIMEILSRSGRHRLRLRYFINWDLNLAPSLCCAGYIRGRTASSSRCWRRGSGRKSAWVPWWIIIELLMMNHRIKWENKNNKASWSYTLTRFGFLRIYCHTKIQQRSDISG